MRKSRALGGSARALDASPAVAAAALALLALAVAIPQALRSEPLSIEAPADQAASPAAGKQARNAYGKLPLSFIPNRGQTDRSVHYYAKGSAFAFYFSDDEAMLSLGKNGRRAALALRFLGANPSAGLVPAKRLAGRVNYLVGDDPVRWQRNLPTYSELRYRELWPGVDMVFRGRGGKLKYEFIVRPRANPKDIRLGYKGAQRLSLTRAGSLLIHTPNGVLRDARPRSFQLIGGRRVPVASRFTLAKAGNPSKQGTNGYGFSVSGHDPHHPLVIDPGLAYATFLGGADADRANDIAVDARGSAYVTGTTSSTDFPTTPGAHDRLPGGTDEDAFVTKLTPGGSELVYSTYLGGSIRDLGDALAVDSQGSVYVTGHTRSPNFPNTPEAYDSGLSGVADAFVTKLNSTGSGLVYSTYLGGAVSAGSTEQGLGIAVDAQGSAYLTGHIDTTDFPTTAGAYDRTQNGAFSTDAFVTKLNPAGSALAYSTFLGGAGRDLGRSIALDHQGNAYVTGGTESAGFPTTPGAYDASFGCCNDAFVTKLDSTGSALAYSTFLGGAGTEFGGDVAVDSGRSAYLTGFTDSTNFPTTDGAYDGTANGSTDAFVTKLDPAGASLMYSTYLGGAMGESGTGIAVDPLGVAYVSGNTASSNFPTTADAHDSTFAGGVFCPCDIFLTKLNAPATGLDYSTFLGGSKDDFSTQIAIDARRNAYLSGWNISGDFPTTAGAYDTTYNGGSEDALIAKLTTVDRR